MSSVKQVPENPRRAVTLIELLVVITVIGVLLGILLPAVQSARESSRRLRCQNNLKQVGISILAFESAEQVFPASGWTQSGPGNPYGKFISWRTTILPYLEQSSVKELYRIDQNWWEGTNLAVASIPIPIWICPSTPELPPMQFAIAKPPRPSLSLSLPLGRTDYEAVQGVQPTSIGNPLYTSSNRFSVMHRNSRNAFAAITDGSSNTIMIAETAGRPVVFRRRQRDDSLRNDQGIGWADGEGAYSLDGAKSDGTLEGCTPALGCNVAMNARNDNEPYSFHASGAHFLFADGHVSHLSHLMELSILAALCTRAAGEVTGDSANEP
ncbi:hypothetical protein VN12_01255 [Pirellula sp. SH-Sr6A]|uniref:DUF1559 domain-containing protein n=1 Tax=Pirellula sp. SH-Sr6A TaxID=1632865 RepID=UPI00078B312F|nr:DUF1559 domain-containing protein [Pirellula sp. SH-Sr6A]AMV30712.1 hypothetical protein VN12_01255 [Pirellula sp. SH-Sr6A]